MAEGLTYVWQDGATAIPDLPDVVPGQEVMPQHFGAMGNGIEDDTAALQAALDHLDEIGGGTLNGIYGSRYLCGEVSAAFGVSIDGRSAEVLASDASFLTVTGGARNSVSAITNLKIIPQLPPSVGSFGIFADGVSSGARKKLKISNVTFPRIEQIPFNTNGFEKYVRLSNLGSPELSYSEIKGTYNALATGPGPSGQFVEYAVYFENQVIAAKLDHLNIGAVHTAIHADSATHEGMQLYAIEAVGVRDAYILKSAALGGPGIWMNQCHANSTRVGIDVTNRVDVQITGCSVYRSNVLWDEDYIAHDFTGAFNVRLAAGSVTNSIVTGSSRCDGVRLLNSAVISAVGQNFSNVRKGFVSEGGTSQVVTSGLTFAGNSGFSETILQTASSDVDILFGPHEVRSTWSKPYVVATVKDSIVIDVGREKYNRTAAATYTAATTILLTPGSNQQVWRIGLATGTSAYDVNVDLSTTGARDGDYFDFYLNLPSAADRRIVFRNGSGGSAIATVATATSKRYGARFAFIGSAWQAMWINESVFM